MNVDNAYMKLMIMVYYDYFSPKNGIVGFFLNLI